MDDPTEEEWRNRLSSRQRSAVREIGIVFPEGHLLVLCTKDREDPGGMEEAHTLISEKNRELLVSSVMDGLARIQSDTFQVLTMPHSLRELTKAVTPSDSRFQERPR